MPIDMSVLCKLGATCRIAELKAELAELEAFCEEAEVVHVDGGEVPENGRRPMSAAARKKMSQAAKARWAKKNRNDAAAANGG